MSTPINFEVLESHAIFHPTGQISMEQGVQLMKSAIAFARNHQIRKLMVVTTDLIGFEPPSLAARRSYIRDLARVAQGQVCVALVSRPEIIDFEKIGTIVAKTAGQCMDIFTSEEEALGWLQSIK